jgi:hypothetical protein
MICADGTWIHQFGLRAEWAIVTAAALLAWLLGYLQGRATGRKA